MSYTVHEIFFTLQGEGAQTGRPSVFCRFSGCNLWSGREHDRAKAICRFCDTDFTGTDGRGGGKFKRPRDLAEAIAAHWPGTDVAGEGGWVVLTGGEPTLQVDQPLLDALHELGFAVAIETNGTKPVLPGVDWVCVSPKARAPLVQTGGNECKLVFPQAGIEPADLLELDFTHFFLQPMDGPDRAANTELAVAYCLANPPWRLSLQTHKLVGLP